MSWRRNWEWTPAAFVHRIWCVRGRSCRRTTGNRAVAVIWTAAWNALRNGWTGNIKKNPGCCPTAISARRAWPWRCRAAAFPATAVPAVRSAIPATCPGLRGTCRAHQSSPARNMMAASRAWPRARLSFPSTDRYLPGQPCAKPSSQPRKKTAIPKDDGLFTSTLFSCPLWSKCLALCSCPARYRAGTA